MCVCGGRGGGEEGELCVRVSLSLSVECAHACASVACVCVCRCVKLQALVYIFPSTKVPESDARSVCVCVCVFSILCHQEGATPTVTGMALKTFGELSIKSSLAVPRYASSWIHHCLLYKEVSRGE